MALQLAVMWVALCTLLPPPAAPNQMWAVYRLVYLPAGADTVDLGIGVMCRLGWMGSRDRQGLP
jgi:hypothetical protein